MSKLNNRDKDKLREKIRADKIISRMQAYVLGTKIQVDGKQVVPKMDANKIRASLGLLNKVLPDYRSTEVDMSTTVKEKVVSSTPLKESEWSQQYGDNVRSLVQPDE
tara:strand:+ start:59 stop:379 length:321 start_codon:yes stop_codon:yes gene_type:complete